LKWPNDVHFAGRKLSGILVEYQQVGAVGQFVLGIGINTGLSAEEKALIDQPVVNVADAGVVADRTELVIAMVGSILRAVETLQTEGFTSFREEFDRHHSLQGKEVCVLSQQSKLEGLVTGVGPDGSLMIQCETGVQQIIAGEVSIRPAG
jgi:BirA family biotin operon repressor/biotin-[acetyl-CoA-carboxylase] ligase